MPDVLMPDGVTVSFPDDMPPEEIKGLISSKFPEIAAKPEPRNTGIGRTMLNQAEQGATFGLADEIQAGIGAGYAKLAGVDGSLGDLYTQGLNSQRKDLTAQQQERPVLSIASNLGGAILTGGAAAGTAPGKAVTSWLGRGGLGLRAAKGALVGATSGAAAGFGTGEGDLAERAANSGKGALVGGAVGAAAPVVASAVKSTYQTIGDGINNLVNNGTWKQPKVTADAVQNLARSAYEEAAQKGGVLTDQFTNKFITSLDNLTPQTKIGQQLAGDSPFTKVVTDIKKYMGGKQIGLAEAQDIDEHLSDMVDAHFINGRLNKQGKKILDVQTSFRQLIDNASGGDVVGGKEGFDALKQGRKLWSSAAKLRDIEKIITRAELSETPATAIKSGFRTMLANPARLRGFSAKEQELIRKAAETGLLSDGLRSLGSRLVSIGSLVNGGGFAGTATAHIASTASRSAATKLQIGKASKIAEAIAQGAVGKQALLPPPSSSAGMLPSIFAGANVIPKTLEK